MMPKFLTKTWLALAVAIAAPAALGQGGDLAGFRAMANTKLVEMASAMATKKSSWFEKNFSEGFSHLDYKNRTTDRKGALNGIEQTFKQFEKITVTSAIWEVSRSADSGDVKVRQVFFGRMTANAKGEKHLVKVVTMNLDTWQRTGADWRLAKSKELAAPVYYLNDKPAPASAIPSR